MLNTLRMKNKKDSKELINIYWNKKSKRRLNLKAKIILLIAIVAVAILFALNVLSNAYVISKHLVEDIAKAG